MKDNHATSHAVTTLISLDMSESGIVALSYTVLDVAATKHAAGKIAPATKAAKPAASKAERAVPEPKPKGTSAVVIEHNPSEAPKARGGRAAAGAVLARGGSPLAIFGWRWRERCVRAAVAPAAAAVRTRRLRRRSCQACGEEGGRQRSCERRQCGLCG